MITEDAGCLPLANGDCDLRWTHEAGLVESRSLLGGRYMDDMVATANLELGTLAATIGQVSTANGEKT